MHRKKSVPSFDVVIVGSGLSGLSSALAIQRIAPHLTFAILEQNREPWAGGRTSNDLFYGVEVVTGAGIGRLAKDELLHHLVTQEFHLPIHTFQVDPHMASTFAPVDMAAIVKEMRRAFRQHPRRTTFRRFARPLLGDDVYQRFLISGGYTDYEEEDAEETLFHYGMEDNACCWEGFRVPWKRLVHAMMRRIGHQHFHFHTKVTRLVSSSPTTTGYDVFVKVDDHTDRLFCHANKVILATTIVSLRALLPHHPIYRQIEGQPFLRLYGKFASRSIPVLKRYIPTHTFVPGPLQQLIPMDADKGVYMIAYCDNANALLLQPHLANNQTNRTLFCDLLAKSLGMDCDSARELKLLAIRDFFWKTGTHFYRPLPHSYANRAAFIRAAQHPAPDILVVGEVVSRNQGWTEGALESVRDALTRKWLLHH